MALVVEDGTGLSNSDAYVSEADADAYHLAHSASTTWSGASSADKETAIRLATQYIDAFYRGRWQGLAQLDTQALSWPRSGVEDENGFVVDWDAIPQRLADACAEAALKQVGGDTLLPDLDGTGTISREKIKAGPIETDTEYIGGVGPFKEYSLVEALLQDYLKSGGNAVPLVRG